MSLAPRPSADRRELLDLRELLSVNRRQMQRRGRQGRAALTDRLTVVKPPDELHGRVMLLRTAPASTPG